MYKAENRHNIKRSTPGSPIFVNFNVYRSRCTLYHFKAKSLNFDAEKKF